MTGYVDEVKNLLSGIENIVNNKKNIFYGEKCVIEMKDAASRNWAQMEWPGFYIQDIIFKKSFLSIGEMPGTRYSNVSFDGVTNVCDYDVKSHNILSKSKNNVIGNDAIATSNTINKNGFFTLVIFSITATMDTDRNFYKWHEDFKLKNGKISRYKTNGSSRIRKASFSIKSVACYKITNDVINNDNYFNQGKNSNGNKRNAKIMYALPLLSKHLIGESKFEV